MLHTFLTIHRDAILARMREKLADRGEPSVSSSDLDHGVAAFLSQLAETLRLEATTTPFSPTAIGTTAARHGRDLLGLGFNVSQVVHDYGDICQAITELALEQGAPIGIEEFRILNRCLDTAIAEAVTEHARITARRTGAEENEWRGQVAHELRNSLNTALLAFQTLRQGTVAINGSTGMVLGRSLMALRDLIDGALCEVRLDTGTQRRERLTVAEFFEEIAVVANLHAQDPRHPALGGAGTPRVGGDRGPADPRVRRDEPPEQRVRVHRRPAVASSSGRKSKAAGCCWRWKTSAEVSRTRRATCFRLSGSGEAEIGRDSASGSPLLERRWPRRTGTSSSATCPARDASSLSTSR